MATQKKIIGKLPVYRGEYNKDVVYYKQNIVTYLGSSFISTKDENMSLPCTVGDKEFILSSGWAFFSDSSEAYFMDERFDEMAEVVVTTDDEGEVNNVEPDVVNEAIRKTPQILSKAEQAQARTNISAASLEENAAFKKEVTESNEAFKTEIDAKVSDIGSKVGFDVKELESSKVDVGRGKNILSLKVGVDNNRLDNVGNLIPNTDCYVSTYILCSELTTYCLSSNDKNHPPLQLSQGIAFFDKSFAFVGGTIGDGNNVVTFSTPKNSKYIQLTILRNSINYELQLEEGSYRTAYEPYSPIGSYHAKILDGSVTEEKLASGSITTDKITSGSITTDKIVDKSVTKKKLSIIDSISSENLLNPNDWIIGQYYNADGTIKSAASMSSNLVMIDGAGIYRFYVYVTWFGSSANLIPLFGDNGFLAKKTGTLLTPSSETSMIEVEITDSDIINGVKYIGCSYPNSSIQPQRTTLMVVKGEYPMQYIPFRSAEKLNVRSMENRLVGKFAVFDGDSICAGIGSEDGDYGRGWAGRIQVYNNMNCHNEGVSGAVVVTGYTGSIPNRHSICGNIDNIYNQYPYLDYLILEGGTNDADAYMLGQVEKGTFEANNFDFNNFDTNTIAGAFDMLFYKALNYFPNARIGYIVAQKMGTGNQRYRREIFDLAIQSCEKWGIPYIDLWNGGQLRPEIPSMWDGVARTSAESKKLGLAYYDGQHLTSIGYDILSPKIESWMKSL